MQHYTVEARKNRAMKKPLKQTRPRGTTIRLPEKMKAELKEKAKYAGHSMNSEILARLNAAEIADQFGQLRQDNAEIKALLKELLDRT